VAVGGRPGFMRDPNNAGIDWAGAWKSWVGKDAIKPMNMAGCRPPAHSYSATLDNPRNTVTLGGHNAPCRRTYTYDTYDKREGPSDRTKREAEIFENATSNVRHDPLAAYHPPPDTKLPTRRPEQEPDRWVPMNHNQVVALYNPLSHARIEISKTKPPGRPRADQDVEVVIKKGDPNAPAGNYKSSAETVLYDPKAFRRRRGVTEFMDITHPFKPNFSENWSQRITQDPRVFYGQQGSMVAWMEVGGLCMLCFPVSALCCALTCSPLCRRQLSANPRFLSGRLNPRACNERVQARVAPASMRVVSPHTESSVDGIWDLPT
jgi:hypothetical protein